MERRKNDIPIYSLAWKPGGSWTEHKGNLLRACISDLPSAAGPLGPRQLDRSLRLLGRCDLSPLPPGSYTPLPATGFKR